MASSPKSSLVERLVQDRLRSGDLEASAAQLLHLGEGTPGEATLRTQTDAVAGEMSGDGVNGHAVSAMVTPAIAPVAQSLVTELPAFPSPDAYPDAPGRGAPVALELRPLEQAPRTEAAPSPFPPPGLAPSGLVPPPATMLPVSVQPLAASPPPAAQTQNPLPEPASRETVPATPRATPDVERPDLVQGPPTIDAVALERGGMVDWSRTRSRISEEFRLVQRQILRAAFGPGAEPGFSNLLMVTSARPGEGKSFTSVNLAGSIARQGDHHVLLVDADSKRDSFCYALGLAEMRGLLDLVANPKLDPSPLIVKTPIDRLSILPVGRERERSAELFSTKEMTRLIQSLGRRYADRLLVLDAPPCLSTSDPAVLAPVVGQILFVVEADRTQRDEVEASLDLIQACPNITLVLNKQQISSRYTFGAYSSYYSS
jgi:receptor protein-tyrosine kinase